MKGSQDVIIYFYGGVRTIGGNKILLQCNDKKIFLDFGKDFSVWKTYYEFPYTYPKSIEELISIGAIPKLNGLYVNAKEKLIDAIFISHAHLDHIGHVSLINREIPIFMGEGSKKILEAMTYVSRTSSTDIERNYEGLMIETFRSYKEIEIGDITIKPIHLDHSIPSAYGFIIYTGGRTIVYTGDYRYHGPMKKLTEDFIRAIEKEDVDLIITEGTHANYSEALMEHDVIMLLERVLESHRSLVLAYFGRNDYDRLKTFYDVSRKLDRNLVLDYKRAYLLLKIQDLIYPESRISLNDNRVFVLIPRTINRLTRRIRDFIASLDNVISLEEILKEPQRYIVTLPFGSAREVINLNPPKGSIYLLSSSEPFSEEQEISFEKLLNWLEQLGVAVYHIHSSGHIMPLDLKKVVNRVNPKLAVPIHTERPIFIKNFISEVEWYIPRAVGDQLKI